MGCTEHDIISIYSDELIALSHSATQKRLDHPDLSAKALSPICGSAVRVDITLDGNTIKDIGFIIEGCALVRAVVAVISKNAIGKTCKDVIDLGIGVKNMLENGAEPPTGDWHQLQMLAPVHHHPSRHSAVMLCFDAVEKAAR